MENFEKILAGFSENKERISQILGKYSPDSDLCGDWFVGVVANFDGPHPTRGWDVRISSSIIHLFVVDDNSGKLYRYEFSPYFEYQDYPGGQTYHRDRLRAKKIQSVKKKDDGHLEVIVLMEDGAEMTISPKEVKNFERHYNQGEREKFFNTSMEIHTRLTYNGDHRDLDFSGLRKESTDL